MRRRGCVFKSRVEPVEGLPDAGVVAVHFEYGRSSEDTKDFRGWVGVGEDLM